MLTARRNAKRVSQSLAFKFRQRYNLPPTDPRFLDATYDDMVLDLLAWHAAENPGDQEFTDDDFNLQAMIDEANSEPDDFEEVA